MKSYNVSLEPGTYKKLPDQLRPKEQIINDISEVDEDTPNVGVVLTDSDVEIVKTDFVEALQHLVLHISDLKDMALELNTQDVAMASKAIAT